MVNSGVLNYFYKMNQTMTQYLVSSAVTAAASSRDVAAINQTSTSSSHEALLYVNSTFELLVHGVLLNAVGVLGLVGNLLSIFILSRPQMKGSTNCILIGLASYDSILIISR